MSYLTDKGFSPGDLLTQFEEDLGDAGGVVSFTGYVREQAASGTVSILHLQPHPVLTEKGISEAEETARTRWPLTACFILHRFGDMGPGEAIVMVATASRHRRAAFEAADFLMDYLKTEAVFWKKETTTNGSHWIEPRAEDYEDRKRWQA